MKMNPGLSVFLAVGLVTWAALTGGCANDPSSSGTPLTSEELLEAGPYPVSRRVLLLEDRSRPTMPSGSFGGAPSRSLPTTVWYPARRDGNGGAVPGFNAEVAEQGGPFPLIFHSHGFMSWGSEAEYMASHLAGHGYFVAYTDFPLTNFFSPGGPNIEDVVNQPGDVSFILDALLARNASRTDRFHGKVDPARIGVMGLSLGGMTTTLVSFHPELRDPRVAAAATLAGPSSMFSSRFYEGVTIPLLLVHGSIDAIVDYNANALAALSGAKGPTTLVTMLGGTHTGFADFASPFLDWPENPDTLGCSVLTGGGGLPEGPEFLDILGGEEHGIIAPDDPYPCEVDPLPPSMRPTRQQELTILAVLSFFESWFAPDPGTRKGASLFLTTVLAEENPEIVVE